MNEHKIAVIGLGYVGLPLAIEFGKKYKVIGFDINQKRIEELQRGFDHTLEANLDEMLEFLRMISLFMNRLHIQDVQRKIVFQR